MLLVGVGVGEPADGTEGEVVAEGRGEVGPLLGRVVVATGAVEATGVGATTGVEPSPAGVLDVAAEVVEREAVPGRALPSLPSVTSDTRSEVAPSGALTRVVAGFDPIVAEPAAGSGEVTRVGSSTESSGCDTPTALIGAPAELMAQVARLAVPATAANQIAAPTRRLRRVEGFTPARCPAERRGRRSRRRPAGCLESMISCRLIPLPTPPSGVAQQSVSLAHCPNPTSRGYRPERGRDPAGGGRRRNPLRADPRTDRTWACRDVATGGFAWAPGGDRRAP